MPAIVNPTDAVWGKGYMFASGFGGSTYDVPFGELQNVSFQDNFTVSELRGPSSLAPLGVGATGRTITGSASWAKIRLRQFALCRGGTVTGASPATYTAAVNDEPTLFDLKVSTPSGGADLEVEFQNCMAPSLNIPIPTRDWVIADFTFNVYGNGTNLYTLKLSGTHTES